MSRRAALAAALLATLAVSLAVAATSELAKPLTPIGRDPKALWLVGITWTRDGFAELFDSPPERQRLLTQAEIKQALAWGREPEVNLLTAPAASALAPTTRARLAREFTWARAHEKAMVSYRDQCNDLLRNAVLSGLLTRGERDSLRRLGLRALVRILPPARGDTAFTPTSLGGALSAFALFQTGSFIDTTTLSPRKLIPALAARSIEERLRFGELYLLAQSHAADATGNAGVQAGDSLHTVFGRAAAKDLAGRLGEVGVTLE